LINIVYSGKLYLINTSKISRFSPICKRVEMDETTIKPTNQPAFDKDTDVDVIVLGVGTCGEDLSLRLLGAGLRVVGIEAALVGGECAYWACLPSKMMIRAAGMLEETRRVGGMAGQAKVIADWAPVAERVRTEAAGGWDDSFAVRRFEERGGRQSSRSWRTKDRSWSSRRGTQN
jgi:hypothetical protein